MARTLYVNKGPGGAHTRKHQMNCSAAPFTVQHILAAYLNSRLRSSRGGKASNAIGQDWVGSQTSETLHNMHVTQLALFHTYKLFHTDKVHSHNPCLYFIVSKVNAAAGRTTGSTHPGSNNLSVHTHLCKRSTMSGHCHGCYNIPFTYLNAPCYQWHPAPQGQARL